MHEAASGAGHNPRSYLVGFCLAVVLTVIPFGLVALDLLPAAATFLAIAAAAVVQVWVHLRFFLHLRLSSTPRENILTLVFAGVLIFLMVGGSLWIMFDLDYRHGM